MLDANPGMTQPAPKRKASKTEKNIIMFLSSSLMVGCLWFLFIQPLYATKPIHKAAEQGNLSEVVRLVEQGTPVDLEGPHFDTPLAIALANRRVDVAKYLITKGADIKGRFLAAIAQKDPELVQMMIDRGCKAGPRDLAVAISAGMVKGGNTELADSLLASGANIDALLDWGKDRPNANERHDGYAALHVAADLRDMKMVSFLVSRGANINLKNKRKETPLTISESSFKVFPNGASGPGTHYYYVVQPSPEIALFLRNKGGNY